MPDRQNGRENTVEKIRILVTGMRRTSFQALVRMIGRASEAFEVLGPAWGEFEALNLIREEDADLVLVDVSAEDGFALCRKIVETCPKICVILVGGRRNYEWLKRGMDSGALGYIAEDNCTGDEIRMEINRVLQDRSCTEMKSAQEANAEMQPGSSRIVARAVDFVRRKYRNNISVLEAAEYAGVSESHLRRCFRQETGMSFVDFLTKYRIDAAIALMNRGEKPVHLISEETGFSSARYFCKVFKKVTNLTPREYMQMQEQGGADQ